MRCWAVHARRRGEDQYKRKVDGEMKDMTTDVDPGRAGPADAVRPANRSKARERRERFRSLIAPGGSPAWRSHAR